MKLRPLSILISAAEGSLYFGHNGSTVLLVLNSCALGCDPSISSIFNGSDCLLKVLCLNGFSTKVLKEKFVSLGILQINTFGVVPSISCFRNEDYRTYLAVEEN
jgi:hypothetical protein